jgi:phosphonatase-like hydrolase
MMAIDLVVFDMAGTTVEDRGQVPDAFRGALTDQGIAVDDGALQAWRGASKREVLSHFVEGQFGHDDADNARRIELAYAAFRRRLERSYAEGGVRAVVGAEETFAWLRERGIQVALTTGFYRKVTDTILRALGWQPGVTIAASVCSDEVTRGRPAPYMIFRAMEATGVVAVSRVIKVGDTALDLQAGTNAGVRGVVGVLSGSQTVDQLGRVAHTHVIGSVADLPALVESAFQGEP